MLLHLNFVGSVFVLVGASTLHQHSRVTQLAARRSTSFRGRSGNAASQNAMPEELEEWTDNGNAIRTTLTDLQLVDIARPITTNEYNTQLHDFIDAQQSRFVVDQGNQRAARYISSKFKELGFKVVEQNLSDGRIRAQYVNARSSPGHRATEHKNIIGFFKGCDKADEVVLLGAHFDSVNWEDTSGPAPGVDDNGSGIALVLTVAKAIATKKFRRSIIFVAFNAEEEGLVGSEHFVELFTNNGDGVQTFGELRAALIADEVAWPGRGKQRRQAIFETSGKSHGTTTMVDTLARLAMLKNASSSTAGDGLGDGNHNFYVNYHGFGSDHMSFLARGIPAVLLIERDDEFHSMVWGHSKRDTFEHVDSSYGAAMSRLALRAVASFANPI